MLEELPSEAEVAKALLADLAGDIPYRIHRYRILLAFDEDFGGSGVMLPCGEAAYRAYIEARDAFVSGNFLSVIMLAQSLIENLLGGHLTLDDIFRDVHQISAREPKPMGRRPQLKELLQHACEAGVMTPKDIENIERLVALRNPISHFRDVNDPQNLTRRSMVAGVHPEQVLFEDARFAISTIISVVGKSQFAIDRNTPVTT